MDAERDGAVDVSIVVAAYDCRAHLDDCLTALLVQRVSTEIIVVDDGSRDGTRRLLELYATHHPRVITVIRQRHTGLRGRARNVGLAAATGRYVFFCDPADRLGVEALRRMVAMGDRNGSDIVLGKVVRHGRAVPRPPAALYRENAERVALRGSAVYDDLSCAKLFRRSLLERHGIRFDEALRLDADMGADAGVDVGAGSAADSDTDAALDLVFSVHAYCHAQVISVVADHDCYHRLPHAARPDLDAAEAEHDDLDADDSDSDDLDSGNVDSGNVESGWQGPMAGADPLTWLRVIRTPIALMARHIPPGPLRDHLLLRHFHLDIFAQLGAPFLAAGEAEREKIAHEVAGICADWLTRGVRDRLEGADRARAGSLHDLDRLVRLARVETARLRHRLTGVEWQGGRLTISGRVSLGGLDGQPGVVLRERTSLEERRPPVTRVADVFSAVIEAASLPAGVWDVYAAVECEGARRLARLGRRRATGVCVPGPRFADGVVVVPFLTRAHGHLTLDVGGHVVRVPGSVRLTRSQWVGRRLRVAGRVHVGKTPGAAAVRHLIWRERSSGLERRVAARATGPQTFAAETGRLRPGTWDAHLELDVGGPPARFPVKVGRPEALERPLRWWHGPVRWTARPYATAVNRRLSLAVRAATPLTLLRRALRRLRALRVGPGLAMPRLRRH
ncbi:glycosyltransferase [Sphaerimonospora cavernae]|uniref:Glycosyltransferase n=1 Tax=Sphaerimonospora cavernae TaxID=1740611 RepID=A0ABV6U8R3_9ACTN